ncbi:MAG: hypothetical protein ACRCVW_02345 [Brevinema sp.]
MAISLVYPNAINLVYYPMENNIIKGTDHKDNKALDLSIKNINKELYNLATKKYFGYAKPTYYHIELVKINNNSIKAKTDYSGGQFHIYL